MQENVKLISVRKNADQAIQTEPIWQYDIGHVLSLEGFDSLPDVFQMHFAKTLGGDSITQVGQNGQVTLPDEFAQTATPIYAWVYVAEAETGLTKYLIMIPVMRRAAITNQVPTPVEQSAIDQAISALNDGVTRAETAAGNAERSAESASESSGRASSAAQTAVNAATTATTKSDEAAQSASSAAGAASAAAGAAQTATTKATEASGSAAQAKTSAESASASASAAQSASQTATTKATEASRSASTASQKAQEATSSASAASQSASSANTAAQAAETAKTAAQTAESNAQGSATAAAESASTASGASAAAAQSAMETAQTAAQFAQDITQLKSDIQAKQNAPSVAGTEGQVLSLDGDGNPVWANVQTESEIDDSTTADDSTWSSEKIAGELQNKADVIISSASGAIASFSDGAAAPVEKLVVSVEPVQDLHGYDSPWPAGGGSNKFDEEWESGGINGDTGGRTTSSTSIRSINYTKVTAGESYRFVKGENTKRLYYYWYTDNSYISYDSFTTYSKVVVAPETATQVKVVYAGTTEYTGGVAINYPSTVTSYSPYSNICPISGWTEANVWDDPKHGGLINWNQILEYVDMNNTWSQAATTDFVKDINNRAVSATMTSVSARLTRRKIETKQNHVYMISAKITVGVANSVRIEISRGWMNKEFVLSAGIETLCSALLKPSAENDTNGILQFFVSSTGTYPSFMKVRDVMVLDLTEMFGEGNEPSTVEEFKALFPEDYYPYNAGEVTTVSAFNGDPYRHIQIEFPSEVGTVYGADLSLFKDGTGELIVEQVEANMGSLTWSTASTDTAGKNRFIADVPGIKIGNANQVQLLCSEYKEINESYQYGITGIVPHGTVARVLVADVTRAEMTGAEFKAAMSGKQLVYPLATPVTYHLTADQISGILSTLKGTNNIWADCGDIESVEYSADTKLYIDNKITEAIAAALNA